jgi:hypothetical protein
MFIAYYDEAGDDGWPGSSPIFVLTSVYLHDSQWKSTFSQIQNFRRRLRREIGLKVATEFHTKHFVLDKNHLGLSDNQRVAVMDQFCDLIASLDVKIINVVINKKRIRDSNYGILDNAVTYSIQRIENDLDQHSGNERFLIITDPGREGKMRSTTRKRQVFNPIPSKMTPGSSHLKNIQRLIEDPLPKDSKTSYFIQVSDLVSYVVYLHMIRKLGVANYARRMPPIVDENKVSDWMNRLRGSLNLNASTMNAYGIVCYPK